MNISIGNTAGELCIKRTLKPVNWLFQLCDVSINEINVSATIMSFPIHSKNGRQKVNTSNTACFLSKMLGETSAKNIHSMFIFRNVDTVLQISAISMLPPPLIPSH